MTTATTAKCLRCGRALRSAASIAAGVGPTCGRKIRTAAKTTSHKPAQVAKAVELIELGAIVPLKTRHTPVFRAVSSKGDRVYLVAQQACTCDAGVRGRACYHRLAVELIAA